MTSAPRCIRRKPWWLRIRPEKKILRCWWLLFYRQIINGASPQLKTQSN
jgi:hypothetical protein